MKGLFNFLITIQEMIQTNALNLALFEQNAVKTTSFK